MATQHPHGQTRGVYVSNSSGGDYEHGQAVAESNVVGVANKQAGPSWDAKIADQSVIADGEEFFLIKSGKVAVDGTFSEGDELFLTAANVLTTNQTTDEVQQVAVTATGGTFTLTFSGQTTSAIAYNASAATMKSALEALSNIAVDEVVVTKSGTTFIIAFAGSLADTNVAQMTVDTASLTGGTATVSTTTGGGVSAASFGTVVEDTLAPDGQVIVDLDLKP